MGRVFKPKYPVKQADGTVKTRRTDWYHIEYTDALGKTRHKRAAPTYDLAKEVLRKAEEEVAKQKAGLPTHNIGEIVLSDLVNRYLEYQKGRVGEKQIKILKARLQAVCNNSGAVTLRDFSPEKVDAFLNSLNEIADLAPKTINGYLSAVKAMLNWAVKMRILTYNPLDCLTPRSQVEKRRIRRPLTQDEVIRLLHVSPTAPLERARIRYKNKKIPLECIAKAIYLGKRNTMMWQLFIYTGLRVEEARQLTWNDLDLESNLPTLTVRDVTSKTNRKDTLPLIPEMVVALKEWQAVTQATPEKVVIELPAHPARTLQKDLAAVGIPYVDRGGRVADVYSLRHTFGTLLSRLGADIKTVQTLMRHSTPSMSFGFYVHADQESLRNAVGRLPTVEQKSQKNSKSCEGTVG